MSAAGGRITAGAGASVLGEERNQEATCYVGNLDAQVTEELLWELFTQAGPVASVYLPKDRVTGAHQGYGFVEFRGGAPGSGQGSDDAEYASRVLNMVRLHGKPLRVTRSAAWDGPPGAGAGGGPPSSSSYSSSERDVGANLFVGGLAPDVDEKALYDTFSAFGAVVATPRVVRDPDTGLSKGFGFVSFDSFEAADAAVEAMNGQFFFNRAVVVTYAFRKDSKSGERHGTPAERLIAAQRRARAQAEAAAQRGGPGGGGGPRASLLPAPHTRFADAPPGAAAAGPAGGGGGPAPMPMPAGMPTPPPPPRMMMMMGGYHMPPPPYGGGGGGGGGGGMMPPPPMPYGGGGGGGMMMMPPPPPPPMQMQMAYPPRHGGGRLPPGMPPPPPPPPVPMPMPPPR
jgi:splicing factor 3B subunit 4